MPALMFLIGFAAVLFLLPFLTKRRFGALGLALGAGYLISTNWTSTVTPYIEQQGVVIVSPPLSVIVAVLLILLPSVLLLFSGPKYRDTFSRIIGSLAFAVLAIAFMIEPLSSGLILDGEAADVFTTAGDLQSTFIIVGLIAATLDVMLYRPPKDKDEKGKK
jgi:hypothetical protein